MPSTEALKMRLKVFASTDGAARIADEAIVPGIPISHNGVGNDFADCYSMERPMDVLTLSRLQFAATISFHYIYPPLSIGLGVMLVIFEAMWLQTKNPL